MKEGFINECRQFISINGCHLMVLSERVLLFVVALDENNGLFLIAMVLLSFKIMTHKNDFYNRNLLSMAYIRSLFT
jgi:hypothetical protein